MGEGICNDVAKVDILSIYLRSILSEGITINMGDVSV
jgi:hypothetical protein